MGVGERDAGKGDGGVGEWGRCRGAGSGAGAMQGARRTGLDVGADSGKMPTMKPMLKRGIWIVNTLGFALFLFWLASMSDRQLLREQDGILYFLPCVPFLFVFVLLLEPKPRKPVPPPAEDPEGGQSGPSPRP